MFAYVGGYTTSDRDGRGNGINVYRVDHTSGGWVHIQHVGRLENPSLFTLTRNSNRLYSVHGGRNIMSAFAIDRRSGSLTLLNQADCQGMNPVDSALDPTKRFLVIANYGSGAIAVMPIGQDGRLQPVSQLVQLEGTPGPNPKRPPPPNAVIFDPSGQFVIVPDKGFDRSLRLSHSRRRLTSRREQGISSLRVEAGGYLQLHQLAHRLQSPVGGRSA